VVPLTFRVKGWPQSGLFGRNNFDTTLAGRSKKRSMLLLSSALIAGSLELAVDERRTPPFLFGELLGVTVGLRWTADATAEEEDLLDSLSSTPPLDRSKNMGAGAEG
jgi:hypothetical protein